ncbi:purine and uridine phosphorylase [Hypoxylon trugodes]|uniref:purine and uridine phosphorylase n=1 Tax=Hypoxylon trugodes TaxID=326681 RepID=UPI0021926D47|nr:purine and uridine phosphorylase [Hypoxylon trugodes]KAI1387926.1 purine and uridine phosphorylase [Hypoxylon trugodes]
MQNLRPENYSILWIAPLEIEAQAALLMLDHRHDGKFPVDRGDDYVFQAGDMCGHNVVIATLPAGQEYGTGSAAAIASQAKKFFPSLWFGLLVGVAAGLPDLARDPPRDIRLGDVLVGIPDVDSSGTIAYDLGRDDGDDELELLRQGHILAQTVPVVRSAIGSIKLDSPAEAAVFLKYYENMKNERRSNVTFLDPGQDRDKLFQLDNDGTEHIVHREPRPDTQRTLVWYGPIGSGEKLMKNAKRRDQLRDKYGIIGLEMEAAGVMNRIPVGVVRGVCGYADNHKNWDWQPYASAMAAAYAKAILSQIPSSREPGGSAVSRSETSANEKSKKRDRGDITDEDGDITTRKKRKRPSRATRTSAGRSIAKFSGQGNQITGSGSISIGGSQTFN